VNAQGNRPHDHRADDHLMVTSTRKGSVPFAPFAVVGDTLVAAAVVTSRSSLAVNRPLCRGLVWENTTSAVNPKLS